MSAVVIFVGIAVGALPAIRLSGFRPDLFSGRGRTGRVSLSSGAGHVALAIQVALTMVVMVGAGLLVRSYVRMASADPGFDTDRLVRLNVSPPDQDDRDVIRSYYPALLRAIQRLPSVEAAGLTDAFRGAGSGRVQSEGTEALSVTTRQFTPGFFEAMGVSAPQGRLPGDADVSACRDCIVLSDTASRRLFGGQTAVGRTIQMSGTLRRVLAVVSDVNFAAPFKPARPDVYIFMGEVNPMSTSIIIRPRGSAVDVIQRLPAVTGAIGPRSVIDRIRTGVELLDDRVLLYHQRATLAGLVTLIGLVISCVGVIAVTSYAVTRRRHEMGIRLAIGAAPGRVVREILRGSCVPVVAGIVAGSLIALFATGVLRRLLFETAPTDPITYGLVAAVLALAACTVSYSPARRAGRTDPLSALRTE